MVLEPFTDQNRIRWAMLGLCLSILVALLYRAWWGGAIGVPCLIKSLTGIPCPMCGMTRSLTALLQGNVSQSTSFHGLGILFLMTLLLVLLKVTLELLFRRSIVFSNSDAIRNRFVWLSVSIVYVIHHGIRLVPMMMSGELAASISNSVFGQMLQLL